jgi:Flp pilus assembly protein TadG
MRHHHDYGVAVSIGRSRHAGQALVETALILPVFLLILVALFDLGRGVFAYSTVGNAAREGARVAAVNQIATSPDCDERRPIEDPTDPHWSITACAAAAGAAVGVTPADVSITYGPPPGTTLTCTSSPVNVKVGCIASVTVTASWSAITPIIGNIIGPINFSSTSQMPIERVFP